MADAAVSHQPFEIGLAEGHVAAVDDADRADQHGRPAEVHGRLREQRHHETQQAVGARLQQNRCKNHASRGRCLGMGVG